MKLSWAARRRWSLVLLLVGLPVYIVAAVTIMIPSTASKMREAKVLPKRGKLLS